MQPTETHAQRRQRVLVEQVHNPPWALTLFLFGLAMLIIVLVAWTMPQPANALEAPAPSVQSDDLRAQREATPSQQQTNLLCFPQPTTVMCVQTPTGKFCMPAN